MDDEEGKRNVLQKIEENKKKEQEKLQKLKGLDKGILSKFIAK